MIIYFERFHRIQKYVFLMKIILELFETWLNIVKCYIVFIESIVVRNSLRIQIFNQAFKKYNKVFYMQR